MGFLDKLFPVRAQKRELQLREIRAQEELIRSIEEDVGWIRASARPQSFKLAESTQNLGNPWQTEWAGLSLDQAFTRGLPDIGIAYMRSSQDVAASDSERNEVMKLCRVLYDQHPHAKAIIEAQVGFIVGAYGWVLTPTPKKPDRSADRIATLSEAADIEPVGPGVAPVGQDPWERDPYAKHKDIKDPIDERMQGKLKKWWKKYTRSGYFHPQLSWFEFWEEAFRRTRRDGEVFIYKGRDKKDGHLSPRFIDPMEIVHPTGATTGGTMVLDPNQNGIAVDPEDPATVIGYWYRRYDRPQDKPTFIPAERIIHVKFGVDSTTRRGLPCLYVIRYFLKHFDTWLQQSLKHQSIQSKVALLRSWTKVTPTEMAALVGSKDVQKRTVNTPAGNSLDVRTQTIWPVIDAPANMELKGFTPAGNYADSEILGRRVLLACAAGEGLSEAMVTADGSNANYASTRITTFIPMEGFKREKGLWSDRIQPYYEVGLKVEVACARLPVSVGQFPEYQECFIKPSPLPNLEGEVVAPTAVSLRGAGVISNKTAQEMVGVDPEIEEERLEEEEASIAHQEAQLAPAMPAFPEEETEEEEPEDEDFGSDHGDPQGEGNGNGQALRSQRRGPPVGVQ